MEERRISLLNASSIPSSFSFSNPVREKQRLVHCLNKRGGQYLAPHLRCQVIWDQPSPSCLQFQFRECASYTEAFKSITPIPCLLRSPPAQPEWCTYFGLVIFQPVGFIHHQTRPLDRSKDDLIDGDELVGGQQDVEFDLSFFLEETGKGRPRGREGERKREGESKTITLVPCWEGTTYALTQVRKKLQSKQGPLEQNPYN